MRLVTQYLSKTVLATTAIVLAALAGLELFILFIGQLNDIGVGDYGILQAIIYILLQLPGKLYGLFPMIGLVGVLLGLGILASHSELIVMRAAGISLPKITVTLLKLALVIILVMTFLGEVLAPLGQGYADKRKAVAMSSGQAIKTGQGIWVREGANFLHIAVIVDTRHLQGITRYQLNEQKQLMVVSFAKAAHYRKPRWVFEEVDQTFINANGTYTEHVKQQDLDLSLRPNLLKIATAEPLDMSLRQLYQTVNYHRHNGLHVASYSLAFWQRLWQPVATLVMMLLAIPFIFGPLRMANLGLRLLAGISLGFSFYILNEFFGPLSLVMQFSPFVAAVLPSMLFAIMGGVLMLRAR